MGESQNWAHSQQSPEPWTTSSWDHDDYCRSQLIYQRMKHFKSVGADIKVVRGAVPKSTGFATHVINGQLDRLGNSTEVSGKYWLTRSDVMEQ